MSSQARRGPAPGGRARPEAMASPWWETGPVHAVVADEDHEVQDALRGILEPTTAVSVCSDGAEALWLVGAMDPALVFLSVSLPVVPAEQVARVLTTHRTGPMTVVVGVGPGQADQAKPVFAAGADRVLARPYGRREVESLLEQAETSRSDRALRGAIRVGELTLDGPAFTAYAGECPLRLGLREFELLGLLMLRAGKVVPLGEIQQSLGRSRGNLVSASTVSVHVRHLRARLRGTAEISAVRGVGYRLTAEPVDVAERCRQAG